MKIARLPDDQSTDELEGKREREGDEMKWKRECKKRDRLWSKSEREKRSEKRAKMGLGGGPWKFLKIPCMVGQHSRELAGRIVYGPYERGIPYTHKV